MQCVCVCVKSVTLDCRLVYLLAFLLLSLFTEVIIIIHSTSVVQCPQRHLAQSTLHKNVYMYIYTEQDINNHINTTSFSPKHTHHPQHIHIHTHTHTNTHTHSFNSQAVQNRCFSRTSRQTPNGHSKLHLCFKAASNIKLSPERRHVRLHVIQLLPSTFPLGVSPHKPE